MEIRKYTENWRDAWDSFVLESNNGTLFHLQQFLEYQPPEKFSFNHLMFFEKDRLVAVLPGMLEKRLFESPIGASFGSIVTPDIKFSTALELVTTLLAYGERNGIDEFLLTSAPPIYEKFPNQNLDFALLWKGFRYNVHYISSAIKLPRGGAILERFQSTVRNNVRKAMRNDDLRVEINERYDQFYPILEQNLSKHASKPTHSYDDLQKLRTLLPESLRLFMVYNKNKPIAGSLVFLCNDRVALCFYNMLLYEYAQFKPIHRVLYEVVTYASEHGYQYVDLGVSQDTSAENPMTPNLSLIAFKESFDAKTIMRNTLHIKL